MTRLATVLRYSSDPAYRARLDAERAVEQAKLNARISAAIARNREARGLEA